MNFKPDGPTVDIICRAHQLLPTHNESLSIAAVPLYQQTHLTKYCTTVYNVYVQYI